jgi:acyl carrier protein
MDYKTPLIEFIKQDILHGRNVPLDDEQDLLSAGVLDSLGILRVVAFLEERFGVRVPDEDVVFENFQSIRAMTDYVTQQKAVGKA